MDARTCGVLGIILPASKVASGRPPVPWLGLEVLDLGTSIRR